MVKVKEKLTGGETTMSKEEKSLGERKGKSLENRINELKFKFYRYE